MMSGQNALTMAGPKFLSTESLLRKAIRRFLNIRPRERPLAYLSTCAEGEYAIVTDSYVLVAQKKSWTADKIVSCPLEAVKFAANEKKTLLLFVEDERSFFEFSPGTIMLNAIETVRDMTTMLDFSVTLALIIRVDQLPSARR